MTPAQFRRIALSLPNAVEGEHMGHADFRVGGKIFATLGSPDPSFGMVQLAPDQQALLVETSPHIFRPVPGGWGRGGSTHVILSEANAASVKNALMIAWRNRAPKDAAKTEARKSSSKPLKSAGRKATPSLDRAFARARKAAKATKLPGIEEATSYGTPSLNVKGKLMLRVKDADTLVLRCALEDKAMLIQGAPGIYFETDHYVGWPAVLVRLTAITDEELAHRIAQAWHMQAPKKLKAEHASASSASITTTAKTKKKIARKSRRG